MLVEVVNYDVNSVKEKLESLNKVLKYDKCYRKFPAELVSFKTDLQIIFHFSDTINKYESLKQLQNKISEIGENFKKCNFVIDYNSDQRYFPATDSNSRNVYTALLYKEIKKLLYGFNKGFYKLKRF